MVSQEALAAAFSRLDNEHHLNGAILVSQDGDSVFEHAYGFASHQLDVRNTLESKFHIASVTKMFIAMAALILVEQGGIELHRKPSAYLPELAVLDDDITLHHLLSHTSGLREIYETPNLRLEMMKLKNEQGDLLSYLANQPQLFRPGAGWSYSSTGFILMGYLMERVTGLPFAELLKRSVFDPVGLTNTGVDHPREINPGRVYGHAVEDGALANASNDRLSLFAEAPGELYSTVRDLKKWCDTMFDCPLVSPQTLQMMLSSYGQVAPELHYGYGWFLAPRFRMHGGGTPGFLSHIRQYPEHNLSVIVLLNSERTDPVTIIKAVEPLLTN